MLMSLLDLDVLERLVVVERGGGRVDVVAPACWLDRHRQVLEDGVVEAVLAA